MVFVVWDRERSKESGQCVCERVDAVLLKHKVGHVLYGREEYLQASRSSPAIVCIRSMYTRSSLPQEPYLRMQKTIPP